MVFVLDNYDSFTYNLVQYMGELGAEMVIRRNDELSPAEVEAMHPDRILISPGPCTPQDAGISMDLIRHFARPAAPRRVPILGVCLGHQAIGAAFGGNVVRAPKLMHGKTSEVAHDGRTIFTDIPSAMICTRYHSLIVEDEGLPDVLEVSARAVATGADEHHTIMALRHRELPIEGVQFHPESVLTVHGKKIIENFLRRVMALAKLRRLRLGIFRLETALLLSAYTMAHAQTPIGTVSTLDATVTGASLTGDDRAVLGNNGTVVAKDHVAYVQLFRGGSVKVCATSGVHLTAGVPVTAAAVPDSAAPVAAENAATSTVALPTPDAPPVPPSASGIPPLMVALDRGAMEIRTGTISGDIVMTPDLRFTFNGDGQLDVHIRVTRNGDTCVENRIAGLSGHPELRVGSLFGNETYNILPGQHVLFEGGNLREVVDNESSPCGCPEAAIKPPTTEVGDISLTKVPQSPAAPATVQHPFPADVSQGLAPPPPVPQAPRGVVHTQVATTLVYNPVAADAGAKKETAAKPPAPAQKSGFFHSIGRFFKHVF